MTKMLFDYDLVVALLKFILPTKNEEENQTAEFLACRFHETWLYLPADSAGFDDYLTYVRQKLHLSDSVAWTDLFLVAERMEEHLDAKDLLDAGSRD